VSLTTLSRRRFLRLGGLTILSLGGSACGGLHTFAGSSDGIGQERSDVRIDLSRRVFNGQDLQVASFLEAAVAPAHPDHEALIRAAAGLAEGLAWALAPSGAAETWRLDELAGRRGPDLSTSDDPEIRRDREEADRRFRDTLCIVLPGTEFFRLYLESLRPAHAVLGRPAAARLTRMAGTGALGADDVDFLMGPDGPECAALAIRPLHSIRRYTHYRYLGVHELFQARAGAMSRVDLVVPAMAPHAARPGLASPPTPLSDQVLALARIVQLSAGRVHPLVPFEPEASETLALVQDAVERRGFVGITLSEERARGGRVLQALRAWCEREDVPIVVRGARAPWGPVQDAATCPPLRDGLEAASLLGLRKGRRARERLERFYDRQGMAAPRWMLTLDQATASPSSHT
jgi:nucleotide-binding universal stress UspA family protein